MSEPGLQIRCVGCQKRCHCYFRHCHTFTCHGRSCEIADRPPYPNDRVLPDGTVMFETNDFDRAYFMDLKLLAGGAIICILDTRRDMCLDVSIERPGGVLEIIILEPWIMRPPRTGPAFDGWNWQEAFIPVYTQLHSHSHYLDKPREPRGRR